MIMEPKKEGNKYKSITVATEVNYLFLSQLPLQCNQTMQNTKEHTSVYTRTVPILPANGQSSKVFVYKTRLAGAIRFKNKK